MNALVILAACMSAGSAQLLAGHPGVYAPVAAPSHQFHAQDEFGQFSFGHAGGPSARSESRNAYGVTTGSYQYLDGNGLLQTVNYIADPVHGFRVAGTNLPVGPAAVVAEPLVAPVFDLPLPVAVVDTPEVAEAKAAHLAAVAEAAAAAEAAPERKRRDVIAAAGVPLGYGLGLGGLGYAGHLGLGYAGLPALPAAAPATIVEKIEHATPVHAPLVYSGAAVAAAPAAPAAEATLTTIKLNPGHAIHYRVYPDVPA